MEEAKRSLNFIEHIIEEDLSQSNCSKESLRFRFPPEPNGYLHIGHASSICLNFGLGNKYNAPVNLRFDDTNPSKEEQEFVDSIKADVSWLGFQWAEECYASDTVSIRKARPAAKSTEVPADASAGPKLVSIRQGTKQALLIEMLQRPEGASITEIVEATSWQAHTVRGAISAALKKKLGLAITSEKHPERGTVYKLDAA